MAYYPFVTKLLQCNETVTIGVGGVFAGLVVVRGKAKIVTAI